MNLREGMRRVGMVLGLIGFCVGSFVAYDYVNKLLGQAAAAREYQAQSELKAKYEVKRPDGKIITVEGPRGASEEEVIAQAQKLFNVFGDPIIENEPKPQVPKGYRLDDNREPISSAWRPVDEWDQYRTKPQPGAKTPKPPVYLDDEGNPVGAAKAPSFWQYLQALAFPLFGFLMPWGTLKTLTWIGIGFYISPTQNAETPNSREDK